MVEALTLKTTPSQPSLRGKNLTAELRVAPSGVQQEAKYPLQPASGVVGENFEMGKLDSKPQRRVELRVELPWGQYYRKVSSEELSRGTIDLTIYPHGDNSELTIKRHGILVQPFPKRMMSREYVVLKNSSQAMAGGPENPITFELPDGIQRIIPGPGMGKADEMKSKGGTYKYTNLIPPGETMIGFFYMIRPGSGSFTLNRSISLPTGAFAVRVPSYDNLNITTDDLKKAPAKSGRGEQPSGHAPEIYRTRNLQPGDSIKISFEGLDEITPPGQMRGGSSENPGSSGVKESSSRPSSFSNVSWPLVLGIAFSVMIFVGSYGYVQYKLAQAPASGVSEDFVIREIANLDQEYDDGAIDEAFYKRTRRRWKQKAEEISGDESA
ncbi:MAG: hypothetical protein ABEH89_00270 [bacterium]